MIRLAMGLALACALMACGGSSSAVDDGQFRQVGTCERCDDPYDLFDCIESCRSRCAEAELDSAGHCAFSRRCQRETCRVCRGENECTLVAARGAFFFDRCLPPDEEACFLGGVAYFR